MTNRLVYDDKERVAAWVANKVDLQGGWGSHYAMGAERDGDLVAGIVFNNFNGANAIAHIAVTKPGKDMIALLRAAADYAFRQCKLKRLTGLVPMSMPDVIKFDKKIGWQEEFVVRDGAPDGDMMMLVMRPETCPWWHQESTT